MAHLPQAPAPSRRERLHEATRTEIKQIARELLAAEGTAALSLRAIARRMGMTAPGLYRYYPSINDLLTALIVDSYNDLGDQILAARTAHRNASYADQFLAIAYAYRAWALFHKTDYLLIFANPMPGYEPPPEIIGPASHRTFSPFWGILQEAWEAGQLRVSDDALDPPELGVQNAANELHCQLAGWREYGQITLPAATVQALLGGWGKMQGLVMLELFGYLHYVLPEPRTLYEAEMQAGLRRMGLAE
ncbi:MAG: TetR/AcrR family transcriptional regulator [Chloroflexaceae bacterium]|nr:TetR/AcrR family transcriptional regulator [Chloroflexaceae bacterium]